MRVRERWDFGLGLFGVLWFLQPDEAPGLRSGRTEAPTTQVEERFIKVTKSSNRTSRSRNARNDCSCADANRTLHEGTCVRVECTGRTSTEGGREAGREP